MKISKLFILFIVTAFIVTTTSCKKGEDDATPTPTTGTINVTLVDGGYGTVTGIEVSLVERVSDTYLYNTVTSADGKVTFQDILPGTYFVSAYKEGEYYSWRSDDFQLIAGQTKTITMSLD